MRKLFHDPLSPSCRKVRVVLAECGLDFELAAEDVGQRREAFLAMNPAGEVPVLVEESGHALADGNAIAEYLREICGQPDLLGGTPLQRAETRRLVAWFDGKMHDEVTRNVVFEKVHKSRLGQGAPDASTVRAGLANMRTHLDYVAWLMERRSWLAGDRFSLADIAAAAHFSCIDYVGDVPWSHKEAAREWYARVKSRPSFQALLRDRVPGLPPAGHYDDLDF